MRTLIVKNAKLNVVNIWTDGSCLNNGLHKNRPSPGGWAAILIYKNHIKELSGSIKDTTNNRAELLAIINALKIIKKPCKINIITDSNLIVQTLTKGWKKSKNTDLWLELNIVMIEIQCDIEWTWIKGHSNTNIYNERCNTLAQIEAMKLSAMIAEESLEE